MKPWEEEHKRKNEREKSGSEESVREGESGLLGLDPLLKGLSLPLLLLFIIFFGISFSPPLRNSSPNSTTTDTKDIVG